MSWHDMYREYLKSEHWHGVRKRSLARVGHCCQRCGDGGRLEVHHKHYRSLGRELVTDIEVLCHHCHLAADAERESTRHSRSVHTAFNTWARNTGREGSEQDWDAFHRWQEDRR
mgnify:CR=1 FL=1